MRRSSSLPLAAACLLLAAAAYVWLTGARTPTPPAPAVAPPAAPAAIAAAPSPAPATAPASAATPSAKTSAERRTELDRRAAAGDVDAMAELGGIIGVCRHYSPISAQHIEETVVDGMAAGVDPPLIAGTPVSPELLVLMLQQGQSELDRRCAGIDRQQLRDDLARAPALLERAADEGRIEAMLDYPRYAFVDYDGAGRLLADADEIARRKDKARAYLREALRRGEARALLLLGDAYASGPLEKIDPLQAYAHVDAFFQSPAGQEWSPRLRELYLQALAQHLDAQQRVQAHERAAQIYRDFLAGTPPR